PDRAEQLGAERPRLAPRQQPERGGELHQPVELRGDDNAQSLELRGDGRPGEVEDPAEEAEAEQDGEKQPPRPRDRQDALQQPGPAVEEDREDRATDDQQQRLGEDDDADDEQSQPEPDRGLLKLAPDERIAELRRARPLDMGLGRRRSLGHRRLPNCALASCPPGPNGTPSTRSADYTRRSNRRGKR